MTSKQKKNLKKLITAFIVVALGFVASYGKNITSILSNSSYETVTLDAIEDYDGTPYIELNNNIPNFTEDDKVISNLEEYSELDELNRCGIAYACLSKDTMPTSKRTSIGMIKPSGWHTVRYDDLVDGKYLYNRCHLIAYCLAGENANEKNLITGTRYLNIEGMLPYETQVANYIDDTNNHVLYRVAPIFKDDELVCRGVTIEAYSIEDYGEGICFYVYLYNVQPGIEIDYLTGESKRAK